MAFNVTAVDHIALVTHDPIASAERLQSVVGAQLLWQTPGGGVVLDIGGLLVVFEGPKFPPAAQFLATKGEGIQHVGISVSNLDEGIAQAEAQGARLLNPNLDPGGVRREILVHPKSGAGVLWQVIQWAPELVNDQDARRAALRNGDVRVPGLS